MSQEKEDFEKQIEELQETIRITEKNLSADKRELQSLESDTKRISDDLERVEKEMGKSANPALVRRLNEVKMRNQSNYDRIDKMRIRISEQEKMLDAFKEQLAFLKNFVAEFY